MYYILIQQTDSQFPLFFLKHGSRTRVESKQVTTVCKSDVARTIVPVPHTSTTHADTKAFKYTAKVWRVYSVKNRTLN